jgi:hypothetical protein
MASFFTQLKEFSTKTQQRIERTRRAIIIELFISVIMDTPVLTGRLRGNWQATIGSPAIGETGARGGASPGLPAELNEEVQGVAFNIKGDQPAYLVNNLPYAHRVEFEGWSHTKAPQGMMRINVIRVTNKMNEIIRKAQQS